MFVTEWYHNCYNMRRDVFQAIADPTRRKIIAVLAKKSLNLNAVAEQFDVSRPAISKQIKILAECGLVRIRKEGRERFCDADLRQLQQLAQWVEPYRVFWTAKLDALDIFLQEKKAANKKKSKPKTKKL
jgi:DNA-binding transcriptional ArsR family regulator